MILPPKQQSAPSRGAEKINDLQNLDFRPIQEYEVGEIWNISFPGSNGKEFAFTLSSKKIEVTVPTTILTITNKFLYNPVIVATTVSGETTQVDYTIIDGEIEVAFSPAFTGTVLLR